MNAFAKFIILMAIVFTVIIAERYLRFLGPSNFEDCVLKYVGETKSDKAAQILYITCRDKFGAEKKAVQ